jgi:hypothetical protein
MSTVIEQVEAFRQYVLEQTQIDASEASLEDLFQRWSIQPFHPPRDTQQPHCQHQITSVGVGHGKVAIGRASRKYGNAVINQAASASVADSVGLQVLVAHTPVTGVRLSFRTL